eukprot:Colp12_sorted_trinity150504_noHs@27712
MNIPEEILENPLEETDHNQVFHNPAVDSDLDLAALSLEHEPLFDNIEGWYVHPNTPQAIQDIKRNVKRNEFWQELSQRSFRHHFWKKDPQIFVGRDPEEAPIVLTIVEDGSNYRVLIFRPAGTRQIVLDESEFTTFFNRKPTLKHIFKVLASKLNEDHSVYLYQHLNTDRLCEKLLQVEDDHYKYYTTTCYKIGVLNCREGQTDERQMFANMDNSPLFREFTEFLGDKITLKGFEGFKAGLDNKSNRTGFFSVYRKWKEKEVMFHVSTLLPFSQQDSQQIQRKRHIGNDVCVIIFNESRQAYVPSTIRSKFNHVLAVVRPEDPDPTGKTIYSVSFASKEAVPYFGPDVERTVWEKGPELLDFLFTKLINGQQTAMQAEQFYGPMCKYRH